MTYGILLFILLNGAPSVIVVPKYVTSAVCNVDYVYAGPGGTLPMATATTAFDTALNPRYFYAPDPVHAGKFCRADISVDVDHLPVGTYAFVPILSGPSPGSYGLAGKVELFARQ